MPQVVVVLPVQVRPAVTSEFRQQADRRSHTERQEGIARCTGNSYLVPPGSCQLEIVLSANIRAHVYLKFYRNQHHAFFPHNNQHGCRYSIVGESLRCQRAYNLDLTS